MKVMKTIFALAITMAITLTLTMKNIADEEEKPPFKLINPLDTASKGLPSKRLSRFLADKNPRAADHCHKDRDICYVHGSRNSTCCNNKCIDLTTDDDNCGACKHKCKFTYSCCRGECVDLAYDKRHCGACNNRCMPGGYCIYGMCDYA
ncbi:stigma-specific STIG1-like protein 2 [Cornus florida]|uniref:stigma-specific STIG1-like protein 2 n=1 Tax=Cornus florida TaxID=4283 RepID=UPI00289D4004|nr:stigma-specific STIG1-like protein 2 [Cornus florida]